MVFACGEEIGWRGYLLPCFSGLGVRRSLLRVGFIHGLWHLPVMLLTSAYHAAGNPFVIVPLFVTTLTLAGVYFGYLRQRLAGGTGACNIQSGLGNLGPDDDERNAAGDRVPGRGKRTADPAGGCGHCPGSATTVVDRFASRAIKPASRSDPPNVRICMNCVQSRQCHDHISRLPFHPVQDVFG